MKQLKLAISSLVMLMGSVQALAEGVVIVPQHFDILSVDDTPYEQSLLAKDKKLSLTTGNHILVVKYEDVIDLADGEFETLSSREIIIVLDIQDDFEYRITAPRPQTLSEAREFAFSPYYNIEKRALNDKNSQPQEIAESKEVQQLKYWWNMASKSDKEKFKQWINKKPE